MKIQLTISTQNLPLRKAQWKQIDLIAQTSSGYLVSETSEERIYGFPNASLSEYFVKKVSWLFPYEVESEIFLIKKVES